MKTPAAICNEGALEVQSDEIRPEAYGEPTISLWADLSHDLRTPLNGIIGYSQLLTRQQFGSLTERQRAFIEGIQACGWQLLRLVNQIVDASKIQAGKLALSCDWTDLDTILESVQVAVQPAADEKRVDLVVSAASGLPMVFVDPMKMVQALTCLLSSVLRNSRERGSVSLTACADESNIHVQVATIAEEAGGAQPIPPPAGSYRPPGQLNAGPGSDGLEQWLALRLVEMQGGRLEKHQVGEGITFRVTLPAGSQASTAWPLSHPPDPGESHHAA
jgi:K+-sensing histidine kinase KdpD